MSRDTQELQSGLLQWIGARMPSAQNLSISDFTTPDAGASNETLLFDISWEQDGTAHHKSLVARLQPTTAGVFPEYELDKQYKAMELLADTDVPVPKLAGFEADKNVLGTPFYLMERLPGKVIQENPPYYMEGWFTEMPPETRESIWYSALGTTARIHKLDWQALGFDWLNDSSLGDTPLQQQLAYYKRFLEWTESRGRPYPKLWACYEWLMANQPQNEPTALCWGDCKVANLLVKDGEVTAILDWEMVHLGNPVDDLAWWFTLDNSLSEGLALLVGMDVPQLPGVPSREALIAFWEKESGFSAAALDYYEVLCTFKFGVIMASLGIKYTQDGLIPADMEMDIKNTCTTALDRLMAANGISVG